jgi:hypothetical protein
VKASTTAEDSTPATRATTTKSHTETLDCPRRPEIARARMPMATDVATVSNAAAWTFW